MKKVPQHKKLYEILRKHIEDGMYHEGDLLPSENELCRLYDLTRPTVRQALVSLAYDGYIIKKQGKGSVVQNPPGGIGILSVSGTTSALRNKELETVVLSKAEIQQWPDPFIYPLNEVEKEMGCILLQRLRKLEGRSIFYDVNYIPNMNLPRFKSRKFENASLFDILRQFYSIEIRGGEQRIRAIGADTATAEYLGVKTGFPILHLERKLNTNRIGFFVYSSVFCNTDIDAIFGTF
ncbi:MAG: GntR family transcriptional regulator [Bacteroidetes bacterium]|jgi:DNA-binding GntR family transcriptional regulator|nr:GntR family transcriptional regulator [Bacteroidota bacterium]MBT3750729.1 GntR family transcriptional regulator [Bacteroidota bacterium]MBT4400217.1 GntR family transcriptional regulator [Bacteroidota bacterium]MBT4412050.1 GntR family transcriptional regulator [Bacteroidota bacterium]MBT5425247.1 GntR family transcriptional regulator [Bacteroidota bacterium]